MVLFTCQLTGLLYRAPPWHTLFALLRFDTPSMTLQVMMFLRGRPGESGVHVWVFKAAAGSVWRDGTDGDGADLPHVLYSRECISSPCICQCEYPSQCVRNTPSRAFWLPCRSFAWCCCHRRRCMSPSGTQSSISTSVNWRAQYSKNGAAKRRTGVEAQSKRPPAPAGLFRTIGSSPVLSGPVGFLCPTAAS
jgi:hypothetical protein